MKTFAYVLQGHMHTSDPPNSYGIIGIPEILLSGFYSSFDFASRPCQLQLPRIRGFVDAWTTKAGQGAVKNVSVVEANTDPVLLGIDLTGGFLSRQGDIAGVREVECTVGLATVSVLPLECDLRLENCARVNPTEYPIGLERLLKQKVATGIWLPVEILCQREAADRGGGKARRDRRRDGKGVWDSPIRLPQGLG